MRTAGFAAALLALVVLFFPGCATKSAAHLARREFEVNHRESLDMDFWRFEYMVEPMREGFGIRGAAYLKPAKVPREKTWIDDLWFAAYLCGEDGRVLAQSIRIMPPRPAEPGQGVPFGFVIQPDNLEDGPLFVTFGYRMVLTTDRLAPEREMPFFASQGAVDK